MAVRKPHAKNNITRKAKGAEKRDSVPLRVAEPDAAEAVDDEGLAGPEGIAKIN
jgi:hypothetical protein